MWLSFVGVEAEPVLVDSPATRRQTVEPQQLSHGHDTSPRRGGGYTGTHPVQGHLLPYLGGALLVSTSCNREEGRVYWNTPSSRAPTSLPERGSSG